MITSKDIKSELEKAEKIIKDPKATSNTIWLVFFILISVVIKLLVNVRTNTSLIMKHLNVKLITNPVTEEKKNKT